MSNVVISATESQFSVMKNKISIAYFLYDANGKAVPDNITAVKQKITLSYDLYMANTTEDYTDESDINWKKSLSEIDNQLYSLSCHRFQQLRL